MSHFVYIVRCANGTLYTGYAIDVPARIARHNAGKGAKYTRMNGPVVLLASWEAAGRIEALKLERRIKALTRAQKQALIAGSRALPVVEHLPASAIWARRPARKRKKKRVSAAAPSPRRGVRARAAAPPSRPLLKPRRKKRALH